ncbi:class I SAM-dependent methyltransferase [Actomonas aquatica]|uniref:Class I SAM-dependent methyltransferase n=1 Tax=Actomonas aquatica TaxID=2866162 RepID=A0ABZ1C917_9BACT|nr:class I SAM-dependent methyltransferase [Opitutus sp. WL0086]WRQ87961.1 class I SAM-dependent methyltransferase [Opitutus sp. WL0086]
MIQQWDAQTYDAPRRRLVPCFEDFYGTAAELVARIAPSHPRLLELGCGTGLLSEQVVRRVQPGRLVLLDGSTDMLAVASQRLAAWSPETVAADFAGELPAGPFDVIMSSLAIHHLEDDAKQRLFARVFTRLAPGGLFVNAEQVLHPTQDGQKLFEQVHLGAAQALGSSDAEIDAAVERMRADRCATTEAQCGWLEAAGFQHVAVYYQWFRFAVLAGVKLPKRDVNELDSCPLMPGGYQ